MGWRHIATVRRYLLPAFGILMGCGAVPLELPKLPPSVIRGTLVAESRPPSTIYRDELERAVQRGLGHFLQQVDLRAATRTDDIGRRAFVGFEILALRPATDWFAFDFVPGDVITQIDGVSVEHYDTVIPMFEGLLSKNKFDVVLLRSGQRQVVSITIVERQSVRSQSATAKAPRATK